ncbi:PepSY domain-containing protein [Rheinheimera maricola]|uniref:PepSY domain-containing protein n=1 Tax=Rheinheimera maricola TaxID=2793282 RepID=A0ABS7X9U5_9GAMM|nr:PepSY domain-containing protein [Rheinheimera maricola]MBZ9611503.1 PepSY domain-containing protein [Rheinheimera maricola]
MKTFTLVKWHRLLLWLGGATLIIFALSGITHPIMSWTGPQAVTMRPPALQLDGVTLQQAMQRINTAQLPAQALVKLVPYRDTALVQLTANLSTARQYLTLDDSTAPDDQDVAIWLASHYSGEAEANVTTVALLNTFTNAYPSVNRLLPVYQVDYQNGLSLYIHTESLSMAGITTPYKTAVQAVFRQLHSWQWLDATPVLKVVVMTILLGSALLLALSGAWLLFKLPFAARRRGLRRWHYALSWLLVVPVVLYLLTGIYHFSYKQLAADTAGLTLPAAQPLPAQPALAGSVFQSLDSTAMYNSASLVQADGSWYWRLSEFNPQQQADRSSRFNGQQSEQGAQFLALTAGAPALDDATYARLLAAKFTGLAADKLTNQTLISRFGPDYDFRNKRLPVWQLDYAGGRLFVDAVSGQLIEQQSQASRFERYSFSFVHKWGILQPLLGREGRDMVVVGIMLLVLLMAGVGFAMRLRRRKHPTPK